MATSGYSGTPLAKKLGIKPGHTIALARAPEGFEAVLGETLLEEVTVRRRAQGRNDVIVSFHTRRADLDRRFPTLVKALDVDGGLWVAWPKRASGMPPDLT